VNVPACRHNGGVLSLGGGELTWCMGCGAIYLSGWSRWVVAGTVDEVLRQVDIAKQQSPIDTTLFTEPVEKNV
jgi:hypothetical protein